LWRRWRRQWRDLIVGTGSMPSEGCNPIRCDESWLLCPPFAWFLQEATEKIWSVV
jgi:hypothetical protein